MDSNNLFPVNSEIGLYNKLGDINMVLHNFRPEFISSQGLKLDDEGMYADLGEYGWVIVIYHSRICVFIW